MEVVPTADSDLPSGMAYYPNPKFDQDITLPLREAPVRFAVMRRNGLSSNSWKVHVGGDGSAYVFCRYHMKDEEQLKVSLHSHGLQKITLEGSSLPSGTLDWGRWREPPFYSGPEVVPTFQLLFPHWSLGLTQEQRDENATCWDDNQLFIEAAESPQATIISLVVTDADLSMTFNGGGETPSFPLGLLPVRPGKKLWIVAHNALEEPIAQLTNRLLYHIDTSKGRQLHDQYGGQTLGISATGDSKGGGKFLIVLPIEVK